MKKKTEEIRHTKDPQDEEKITKGEIAKMILLGVAGVAGLGVVMVCPNLVQLLPGDFRRRYPYKSVHQAVLRLDKRGRIIAKQTRAGWRITLTPKGYEEWREYELGQRHLMKPKKWDKKWRVLVFDIPEKRKHIREKVRKLLHHFEFYRLQDSVWVYPYECEEVIDLLRTRYRIRSEALYIRAEFIQQDHWLREHFQIK